MTQFPHLELSYKGDASKKRPRFSRDVNPRTKRNLQDRKQHAEQLSQDIQDIQDLQATSEGTQSLTLFLQIDPDTVPVETLRRFDIEVVAEFEDGFILGASADVDLLTLRSKIERFLGGKQTSVGGVMVHW